MVEEEDPRACFRTARADSEEADPRGVGHPLAASWFAGPLVGVERPWRISAAGSSGKSAKSIDPVGSGGG